MNISSLPSQKEQYFIIHYSLIMHPPTQMFTAPQQARLFLVGKLKLESEAGIRRVTVAGGDEKVLCKNPRRERERERWWSEREYGKTMTEV